MKAASLVLNIVLLLAIIPLYYFHFVGKPDFMQTDAQQAGMDSPAATVMAYVNTDSLFEGYNYYTDISKDYREKRAKIEKQLANRTSKLESKVLSVQRRAQAGLMSRNEISAAEQELARDQQELQTYQQTVSAGLMEEERNLNEKLYNKIMDYLKEYNKSKGYKIIFNYTKGQNIWIAEDALNITDEVLNGLNDAYSAEKTATETEPATAE